MCNCYQIASAELHSYIPLKAKRLMHNVSALKIGRHPPEGENDPRSEKTSVRVTRQTPTRLYQDTVSRSNSGLFLKPSSL